MDRTIGARRALRRTTRYWLVAALAAALLAGCAGGSGSSGFDIVAAENMAIDDALDTGSCVVERGLTICASGAGEMPSPSATATDTAAPTRTGTPAAGTPTVTMPLGSPTPTTTAPPLPSETRTGTRGPTRTPTATAAPAQPSVDIEPDPTDVANCAAASDAQSCTLRIVFVPMEIPADAAYRAAIRGRDPDSSWRIVPVAGTVAEFVVPPDVAVVQTAILVYDSEPGPVPNAVEVLSDSGADAAFVSAPLAVRSP